MPKPLNASTAELRLAAIYSAVLCTACVLLLNVLVLDQGGNHSALFGTWLDRALQRVSPLWVALGLAAPIGLALIRQIMDLRLANAVVLAFCLASAALSVWMLVLMLQD